MAERNKMEIVHKTNPSCQACIEEMALFCSGCPRISENFPADKELLIENWIYNKYTMAECSDYRRLNKLKDDLITALRAFDSEIDQIHRKNQNDL